MTVADALPAAIGWHLRLPEADEGGWSAFVAWLEADPAHAAAYDEVSLADAASGARGGAPLAANDAAPARRWRPGLIGAGSIAACAVAALLVFRPAATLAPPIVTVVADQATPRALTAAGGVQVKLAPGARLRLDPGQARLASLDTGAADFSVRHDAAHPFRLNLGDHALVDTGTTFRVENGAARIVVMVSEGGVLFDPGRADVAIHAGQRMVYDRAADTATLSALTPAPAAAGRTISFVDAPLGEVTGALARASGARITLDKALRRRRFTGVLWLTGSAARDVPHFAEATGTRDTRNGNEWRIGPAGNGGR